MKGSTKSFITLALAVALGSYVGFSLFPAILPPSKLIGSGG